MDCLDGRGDGAEETEETEEEMGEEIGEILETETGLINFGGGGGTYLECAFDRSDMVYCGIVGTEGILGILI